MASVEGGRAGEIGSASGHERVTVPAGFATERVSSDAGATGSFPGSDEVAAKAAISRMPPSVATRAWEALKVRESVVVGVKAWHLSLSEGGRILSGLLEQDPELKSHVQGMGLEKMFDVNLKGVWRTTKNALPQMRKQGEGLIINIFLYFLSNTFNR